MTRYVLKLSNNPRCFRVGGDEDDDRLVLVWTYVAGLVGGKLRADDLSKRIVSLIDDKGDLKVEYRRSLSPAEKSYFREAWRAFKEPEENVEFRSVDN